MAHDPDHADLTQTQGAEPDASETLVETTHKVTRPRVETQIVSPAPPEPTAEQTEPREEPADREEGRNTLGKTAIICVAISVVCGALGAWIYEGVLRPSPPEPPKAAANPSPAEPQKRQETAESNREGQKLEQQIENLSSRVDKLQERFAALPKPEAAPDLTSIKDQLQAVLKDDETVSSLPGRLAALADRVAALEHNQGPPQTEANSRADDSKKTRPASATNPPPERRVEPAPSRTPRGGSDQPKRSNSGASISTPPPSVAAAFTRGAELFHQGRYREARAVFTSLEELYPQDARVWYFAALTNGLVTRRWDGDTQLLVQRGLERERLGSPPPSQIDSTFSGLTLATGRDWLAGYRKSLTK